MTKKSHSTPSPHLRTHKGSYTKPRRQLTVIAKLHEFDERQWVALLTNITEYLYNKRKQAEPKITKEKPKE